VTGFIDNVFPRFESNNSSGDPDMTRGDDQATFGRQRARFFFNFTANEDLRGVWALEIDNTFGAPTFNFTGGSTYVGTEVVAGFRYTVLPGLTWTPRFSWAFLGDAWQSNNRSVQDAWVLINRMIYVF
jgi:hypothetical protein